MASVIHVPEQQMPQYAWGYKADQPIRVSAGMFDAQAYDIKSTSSDMLKFLDVHINVQQLKQVPPMALLLMSPLFPSKKLAS